MKNKSGQNMIEYMILLVAVIAVLIIFLGPEGLFTKRLNESLNIAVNAVKEEAAR